MMTVGEFLRRRREEKHISLEQASEGTNIRINFLKAIENDQTEILPSTSQARGFTRLYATYLGLNALDFYEEIERINQPAIVEPTEIEGLPESLETEPSTGGIKKNQKKKNVKADQEEKKQSQVAKLLSQIIFVEIGTELKNRREALGLSREDVERQLKIREFYLYSLEHGKIDDLPSTVQARGMLNNYASFMNLDAESLQIRYAEGLQRRRIEKSQEEVEYKKEGKSVIGKEPLSGWRRLLTPDLIVGGSVLSILFILIIWGAIQVIRTSVPEVPVPTVSSISEVLVGTDDLNTPGTLTTAESPLTGVTGTPELLNTPVVDLQATMDALNTGPIQVVVVAYQRTFMRITVDGREVFADRVIPGNVYSYSGSTKITLLTGNAAALQVFYNQQDQGILGPMGQLAALEFGSSEIVTPTPRFTPTPTITQKPTLTPLPTNTPLPTATLPTVTITPAIP